MLPLIHKPENLNDAEKLLYDIRAELSRSNEILQAILECVRPGEIKTDTPKYTCKVCGKTYDNKGKLLACARRHKKEGKA